MPIEQDPQEFYHCYQESQKRVELWVKSTTQELRQLGIQAQPAVHLQDKPQLQPKESHERTSLKPQRERGAGERSSSRPSSGSKPRKIKETDTPRPVTPSKSKSSSRSSRRRRETSSSDSRDSSISSYLPYGVLPILYALTRSPALSIVASVILLAGYMLVDFEVSWVQL